MRDDAYEILLPSYPPIDDPEFQTGIGSKKELSHAGGDSVYFDNQVRIGRFLNAHTLFDGLLLFHEAGSGKSTVATAIIDQNQGAPVLVAANNSTTLNNLRNEIRMRSVPCRELHKAMTDGINNPEIIEKRWSTVFQKMRIEFMTYYQLYKEISSNPHTTKTRLEGAVIIMDECHHLHASGAQSRMIYDSISGLLHRLDNKRVVLMTATPMQDQPDEIVPLWNLILPKDRALPSGSEFTKRFLEIEDEVVVAATSDEDAEEGDNVGFPSRRLPVYRWRPGAEEELSVILRGRNSFMRMATVAVRTEGRIVAPMRSIPVVVDTMHEFQTFHYISAFEKDTGGAAGSISSRSSEASLFVFPDGSYGEAGFSRFCIYSVKPVPVRGGVSVSRLGGYTLRWNMEAWRGVPGSAVMFDRSAPIDVKIEFISQFSSIYAGFLREITSPENLTKKCYAYSSLVKGSGIMILLLLLRDVVGCEIITREVPNMWSLPPAPRVMFINDAVRTPDRDVQKMLRFFNRPDNMDGRYCRIMLTTNKTKEGISLFHISQIHILTPSWNMSDLVQAVARGIRRTSHEGMDNPVVRIFYHAAVPEGEGGESVSIDFQKYLRSEIKDRNLKLVEHFVMRTSWDCIFERDRHMTTRGRLVDMSRECDYAPCVYTCDGQNPRILGTDPGNSVAWYDHSLRDLVIERLSRIIMRTPRILLDELVDHLMEGTDAARFQILHILGDLIATRHLFYSVFGAPVCIEQAHPYVFAIGYIPGMSGSVRENLSLNAFVLDPDVVKRRLIAPKLSVDEAIRSDGMLDYEHRFIGHWGRFVDSILAETDPDNLRTKLRVIPFPKLTRGLFELLVEDGRHGRVLDAFAASFPDRVDMTSGAPRHRIGMDSWVAFEGGAWAPAAAPAGATTAEAPLRPVQKRRKMLPLEEMSVQDADYFIFDNDVGFYGFVRGNDFFIRDVRDRDKFRGTNRKNIPQGKKCMSFKIGELLYIYLVLDRIQPHDADFAEFPEIQSMTRRDLLDAIRRIEGADLFCRSLGTNDLDAELTEDEARKLLLMSKPRKESRICSVLRQRFNHHKLLFRGATPPNPLGT